jgi:hypothetical protein
MGRAVPPAPDFASFGARVAAAPGTGTTVIERPPEGPAQGKLAAPAWLVWGLSAALAVGALAALLRSWRRRGS